MARIWLAAFGMLFSIAYGTFEFSILRVDPEISCTWLLWP